MSGAATPTGAKDEIFDEGPGMGFGDENDGGGDVFGCEDETLFTGLKTLVVGVEHGGVDFAGIDGGAADAVFALLDVDGVAESGYAVFAGDVGDAGVGAGAQAGAGDDVDDLAAAVGAQMGEDFADDVVGAVQVDIDDLPPGFEGDVVEIAKGGVDAGVVDDEVDGAELGDGAGDELLDVRVVGDIAGTGEDFDAGGAGLIRGNGERVGRAGGEGEVYAFGG